MKVLKSIHLPDSYRAAVLNEAHTPLKIMERNTGKLNKGEVWVQMKAAPVNPSDLAMLIGMYPHQKKYPFVPGLEGSGVVVASGGGFMANYLLGKRVACTAPETADGTWAEYMKVPAGKCVPLNKKLSFDQGACSLVNPLTALALMERIKRSGSKTFVNTAAASALGKMLIRLSGKYRVDAIHIVRREEQRTELMNAGAQVVLNSSSSTFDFDLKQHYQRTSPTIILDAISGDFAGKLLKHAPDNTILVSYANLSRSDLVIPTLPITRFGKKIEGFHLSYWSAGQSKLKLIRTVRKSQRLIACGILKSPVDQHFSLDEINDQVREYSEHMSAGKKLLHFE